MIEGLFAVAVGALVFGDFCSGAALYHFVVAALKGLATLSIRSRRALLR